jgi:hypothetical protein
VGCRTLPERSSRRNHPATHRRVLESDVQVPEIGEKQFELDKVKFIAALGACEGARTQYGDFTYRTTKPSEKTDWKAVALDAGASEALVKQHTTESAGFRRFLIPKQKG